MEKIARARRRWQPQEYRGRTLRACGVLAFMVLSSLWPPLPRVVRAAPPVRQDAQLDALIARGLPLTYNLRYRPALEVWDEIIRQYPDHPAGYLYRASLLWWQALADRRNEILKRRFDASIRTATEKGKALLRQSPDDKIALAYLAKAYALAARFDATVSGGFLAAVRNGMTAHKHAQAAHRLDPEFPDPLVELGGYDYYAAALPAVIKPFAWLIGARGNKSRGIGQLLRAAQEGPSVRTEAKIVLLSVYYSEERWEDYERTLESLMKEYPLNHILCMWAANNSIERRRYEAGRSALAAIGALIGPAEDEYAIEARAWLNLHGARIEFAACAWTDALEALEQSEKAGSQNTALLVQLYLVRGKVLDALGNREAALAAYRKVLDYPDVEGSHAGARRFLKSAYRPKSNPPA